MVPTDRTAHVVVIMVDRATAATADLSLAVHEAEERLPLVEVPALVGELVHQHHEAQRHEYLVLITVCSFILIHANLTTLQIVVEQLTKNVKEEHLREIFGHYGPIKDIKVPMNPMCSSDRSTYTSPY